MVPEVKWLWDLVLRVLYFELLHVGLDPPYLEQDLLLFGLALQGLNLGAGNVRGVLLLVWIVGSIGDA